MTAATASKLPPSSRYEIIAKIASGGMATVYLGALKGPFGFEQLVAIKRLHAHLVDEPAVRDSLLHEARLASRIRHANVVDVRDIEVCGDEVQLVMTYIEGAPLSTLVAEATRRNAKMPVRVATRIVLDACAGLHAAHELTDSMGKPLALVHRDVSPQNVLVGVDGIARITDFGVARDESSHRQHTHAGALKGKFAYMAPEYIRGEAADRRVDVFALAVVLWEALTGYRLFKGNNDADTISRVTSLEPPPVGDFVPELGDGIDAVFEMALSKNPETRFNSARAFGSALETVAVRTNQLATAAEVGEYVREHVAEELARLERLRLAAARSSRTNEIPRSSSPPISIFPTPEISVRTDASVSISLPEPLQTPANDDTRIAPAQYQARVTGMMGEDENTHVDLANDAPNSIAQDGVPTLRALTAENAENIETPQPPVDILKAPSTDAAPASSEVAPNSGPSSNPRSNTPGSVRMTGPTSMRNLVFQRVPGTGPISEPSPTMREHIPIAASTMPSAGANASPITSKQVEHEIALRNQAKRVSSRPSPLRWFLAACILIVVSGIGVAIFTMPTLRGTLLLQTPNK
ncbi:MAG TPA: protein kinase [Polyangium sp.]|nr:protein kinase [Polyangium sp.]